MVSESNSSGNAEQVRGAAKFAGLLYKAVNCLNLSGIHVEAMMASSGAYMRKLLDEGGADDPLVLERALCHALKFGDDEIGGADLDLVLFRRALDNFVRNAGRASGSVDAESLGQLMQALHEARRGLDSPGPGKGGQP